MKTPGAVTLCNDALRRWYAARPAAATDALLISLRRRKSAVPKPLSAGAERGVALEAIRARAGHVDVRTTQIYVDVTHQRKTDGIAAPEPTRHPLAA